MKKLLVLIMVLAITATTFAQRRAIVTKKDEVKHTSSVPQKVHNLFSKHKHYNGYKTKHIKRVKYVKH